MLWIGAARAQSLPETVAASAQQLRQQGFLTDDDAAQIVEDAQAAKIP